MKNYIYATLAFLGFLGLVGSVGANEMGNIGFLQTIVQLVICAGIMFFFGRRIEVEEDEDE